MKTESVEDSEFLVGWDAVCRYLHVSLRTAKRYHYEGHMPMHRGGGMKPRALKGEIMVWLIEYAKRCPSTKRVPARRRHQRDTGD